MSVEFDGLRILVRDLQGMAPDIRAGLRLAFRAAGQTGLTQAKANASWSSRIPGAITVRTSTTANSAGVYLRVNSDAAPHARPYEGIANASRGYFRHPVFGDRETWVAEKTRPFLAPASTSARAVAKDRVDHAVRTAAARAHFR